MGKDHVNLAVIGGGPGGYGAAFMAADLGVETAIVDPEENPGGVCLYRGCIPSKALLHVAAVIHESRRADRWGVAFGKPKVDTERLRKWKNGVVERLTGGLGRLVKQRGIRHLRGTASFLDETTLRIRTEGGETERLSFRKAIVATGSRPARFDGFDGDSERFLDASAALELKRVPEKLLVIGGGYIGLEIGTVYASLGSRVTVVEMTPGLLPGVDRDLVRVLQKALADRFEEVLLETRVAELKEQKNGVMAMLEGPDGEGGRRKRLFDAVLAAVGRQPSTDGIGLGNIGVQRDANGFIRVDRQQRTAAASVFAVGDAAGEPMLAHKATYEGRIAAEVVAGRDVSRDPAAVPAVVFTDPEIAWAGLTETRARETETEYAVNRFPWAASGRALTLDRTDGLTKLLVDPKTDRILGAGIAGPGAGELIAEAVVAMEMGGTAADLGLCIHPHPTLSETLMEAADLFHGTATHLHRKKRGR